MTNIEISKDNIDEMTDGHYFSEDTAVKYDLQNGNINTILFCICKGTARDMAKDLNLYDNIIEELNQ